MAITPVEIRHLQPSRSPFGYRRSAVDRLFAEIADSFEDVWRERAEFGDRIEHLETELQRHRDLETLLRSTLVSAERAMQEQIETARKQGEVIVNEAHAEARAITRRAQAERERLEAEARRVKALLHAALAAVEERPDDVVEEEVEVRRLAG